jgi:hypothetical protein
MLKVNPITGKVIQIADDVIWKDKENIIYKIFAIESWGWQWQENGIVCQTQITAQDKQALISLPITITIILNDDFDPQELYDKVIVGMDKKETVNLREFIGSSFFKTIKYNRQKITEKLIQYSGQDANRVQIINEIIGDLTFPNQLLSNFADWKIELGQPAISACKGSLCGN